MLIDRIVDELRRRPGLCDDCLCKMLGVSLRQTINQSCRQHPQHVLRAAKGMCAGDCRGFKLLNFPLPTSHTPAKALPAAVESPQRASESHHDRERYLSDALNGLLNRWTGTAPPRDFYNEIGTAGLLELKNALARVNDIITMRLSLCFVEWLRQRLELTDLQAEELRRQILSTNPNASGFDVDSVPLNVVAEVKSNIPVKRGERFGAAQVRGIENDIRAMLGLGAIGAHDGHRKDKAIRAAERKPLKFLVLIDTRDVREAADARIRALLGPKSALRKEQPDLRIEVATERGTLETSAVYLVFVPLR